MTIWVLGNLSLILTQPQETARTQKTSSSNHKILLKFLTTFYTAKASEINNPQREILTKTTRRKRFSILIWWFVRGGWDLGAFDYEGILNEIYPNSDKLNFLVLSWCSSTNFLGHPSKFFFIVSGFLCHRVLHVYPVHCCLLCLFCFLWIMGLGF